MRNLKAKFLVLIACLVLAVAYAEESGGTRAASFDSKPDARIQGLAGTSVCLAQSLMASGENPALCRTVPGLSFSSSRFSTLMAENLYALGAGYNPSSSRAGFFVLWRQMLVSGIDHTAFVLDSTGNPVLDENLIPVDTVLPNFDDIANNFHAGAGVSVLPWLQAGLTGKMILRHMGQTTQTGWGMDMGVVFGYPDGSFHVGLAMQDVVPVKIDSAQNERSVAAGISAKFFGGRAHLTAQVENLVHSRFDRRGSLGLEWRVAKPVILRAGWSPDYYALGSGIVFGPVRLHYALVHHTDLGFENPHRITLEFFSEDKLP